MSFAGQPYIHCPPRQTDYTSNATTFDPKAYTRASYASPPAARPKQNGSLLDFNKHPDSYLILPYGQTSVTPMGPKTKRNVDAIRWVQFSLRVLNMVGAVGMLVCVICLTNVAGTESWMIRAVPATDMLLTTYAIYHLLRGSKARTPASSASYHWFALFMSLCIIPLYVYIVIVDRASLGLPEEAHERWKSMFKDNIATTDLMMTTWIGGLALSVIHLLCSGISLYFACTFRKIASLPPDMNPLEDNLTSRRRTKHKHKDSDLTLSAKHETCPQNRRNSPVKRAVVVERPMSFAGTREADAAQLYSPHNPTTANASRSHLPVVAPDGVYSHPQSAQVSRVDLAPASPSKAKAGLSRMLSVAASSIYSRSSHGESLPSLPRKSSKRTSSTFASSNSWYAIYEDDVAHPKDNAPSVSIIEEDSDDDDDNIFAPSRTNSLAHSGPSQRYYAQYHAVPQPEQLDTLQEGDLGTGVPLYQDDSPPTKHSPPFNSAAPPEPVQLRSLHLDPLHMNPPTPPPGNLSSSHQPNSRNLVPRAPIPHSILHPLAPTSGNISRTPPINTTTTAKAATSAPPSKPEAQDPAVSSAIPARDSHSPSKHKGKYYGDLASAVSGVRNTQPSSPPKPRTLNTTLTPSAAPAQPAKADWGIGSWLAGVGTSSSASHHAYQQRKREENQEPQADGGSETRAYLEDIPLSSPMPSSSPSSLRKDEARTREGDARRRVSGKVVEEGLAPSYPFVSSKRGEVGNVGMGKAIRVVQPVVSGSPWRREMDGRGRVVSRSGVDVA